MNGCICNLFNVDKDMMMMEKRLEANTIFTENPAHMRFLLVWFFVSLTENTNCFSVHRNIFQIVSLPPFFTFSHMRIIDKKKQFKTSEYVCSN